MTLERDIADAIAPESKRLFHNATHAPHDVQLALRTQHIDVEPNGDFIHFGPDVEDDAVDAVVEFVVVFADEKEKEFEPTGVQPLVAVVLGLVAEPTSSFAVGAILPHGLDAVSEEGEIAAVTNIRRKYHVMVKRPKVLDRVHGQDRKLTPFVVSRGQVVEVPKRPFRL